MHQFGLQGQNQQQKMLPKSKQRYYIGYKDGSKSYNADMKRVLTSQNFRFMNNIDQQTPEYIILNPSPALQHEGELGDDTPQADRMSGSKWKRESSALDDEIVEPVRKLQENLHVNYHYLNDPFKEDKEHELTLTSAEITCMVYTESMLCFSLFTILLLHFHPIPFNHYLITLLHGHMTKHTATL